MLTISAKRAASGMVVAMPVMHPQIPGHVLLKPGAELDPPTIQRLNELGVRQIVIEYPPTAFLMRYASPMLALEQAKLAQAVGEEIDALTKDLHAPFAFRTFLDGVRALIQKLVDDPAAAIFMHDVVDPRSPIARHSFNVGFLSLLMGLRLDGYLVANRPRISAKRAGNIESLGLGALLHDVGMLRLSPEVLRRWEATHDERDTAYQKHVGLGFQFVRGKVSPTAAAAILHHHQRLDGSGFPKRQRGYGVPTALHGAEIHIFARIVAVADVFDRFRDGEPEHGSTSGSHAGPAPTVHALNQTLQLVRAHKLDPVVFKALLSVVPAFAPGSVVTLSDGRRCVVTSWEPSRPCEPTVSELNPEAEEALRVGGDRLRRSAELPLGESIDLAETKTLRIAKVDDVDVSGDLFFPMYAGELDLRVQFPGPYGDMLHAITPPLATQTAPLAHGLTTPPPASAQLKAVGTEAAPQPQAPRRMAG